MTGLLRWAALRAAHAEDSEFAGAETPPPAEEETPEEPETTLSAEPGGSYAHHDQTIFAGRVLVAVSHAFDHSVGISDTFELYENVITPEDVRIPLKLSHARIFDDVPVEGFQKLDLTTLVTFVATILWEPP
jgi:hypothetical protein